LQIIKTLCFCDRCNLSWAGFTHHYEALGEFKKKKQKIGAVKIYVASVEALRKKGKRG
jgi:hypothetical protein